MLQIQSSVIKRLLWDLKCASMEQLEKESLYFRKDSIVYAGKTLTQGDPVVAFWEWNVNIYSLCSRKFWDILESTSTLTASNVKFIWLIQYHQLLNYESMAKLFLIFHHITHIIVTKCTNIPLRSLKQIHATYVRGHFNLIIMNSDVAFSNNRFGYFTCQVCKKMNHVCVGVTWENVDQNYTKFTFLPNGTSTKIL